MSNVPSPTTPLSAASPASSSSGAGVSQSQSRPAPPPPPPPPSGSTPNGRVRTRQRRTLSCLPCRLHKLRCDRAVPCQSCCRYGRQDHCRMNPAPSGIMRSEGPGGILSSGRAAALRPNLSCQTGPAPASPSSSSLASSARVAASMSPGSAAWDGKFRLGTGLPSLGVDGRHHHHHHHQRPMSSGGSTAGGAALSPALAHPPPAGHVSSLLPAATGSPVAISADLSLLDDPQAFWRRCLLGVLPTRRQSDLLVDYFFEQFNWFYQAVHAPSFRAQYERFWSLSAADVDLTWLALLFVMLCLSSLYAPAQFAEAAGLDAGELSLLSKRYYAASRQALLAGGYDSKPTLTQIQVFVNTQLYWYGMKNIEALNSHLAMAVRNAQAMGLDKESPPSITDCLEREMRHRLWWDLVSSDTFQAMCLGRPPLLQSYLSTVPFPANCNDADMSAAEVRVHPLSVPTEMSMHHFRARIFKILNRLYIDNGAHLSSYAFVCEVDAEIAAVLDEFPWYFQIPGRGESPSPYSRLPAQLECVAWAHHALHSCIFVHRVRMYRPFLHPLVGDAWQRCAAAATSALAAYRALRGGPGEDDNNENNINDDDDDDGDGDGEEEEQEEEDKESAWRRRRRRSQKIYVQAYQTFSAAVALATFLLVERPERPESIRADIEMVIGDLEPFAAAAGEARCVPLVADGLKVLRRILALYDASRDARGDDSGSGSGSTRGEQGGGRTTVDGGRGGNAAPSEGGRGSGHDPPTALVPAIFSVFGGETSARKYLERCTIDYIINDDQSEVGDEAQTPVGGTAAAGGSSSSLDRFMWDTLLDASVWGDSWDGNWPGLELGFEKVPC